MSIVSIRVSRPLLDIGSYARRGPGRRDRLSPAEVEIIQRTVSHTPEVMVKVLTRGAHTVKAVRSHFVYLDRGGELEIETDRGDRSIGKETGKNVVQDWDLDLDEQRSRRELMPRKDRLPPRLVHKVLFSMPPGTDPGKVLAAVRRLAREEFGAKHRYAMVLHTDEPHPHVHLVVEALSERGARLNIRRETLRRWRSGFAVHLRELGVPANATERAVRGAVHPPIRDGLYRTLQAGTSRAMSDHREQHAAPGGSGMADLRRTRMSVETGWRAIQEQLVLEGRVHLASSVNSFLRQMPAPRTGFDILAERHRGPSPAPEDRAR